MFFALTEQVSPGTFWRLSNHSCCRFLHFLLLLTTRGCQWSKGEEEVMCWEAEMLDQYGNSLPLLLIEMSKFGHSEEIQYIPGDLLGHINVLIITTMAICRNKRLGPQTFTSCAPVMQQFGSLWNFHRTLVQWRELWDFRGRQIQNCP